MEPFETEASTPAPLKIKGCGRPPYFCASISVSRYLFATRHYCTGSHFTIWQFRIGWSPNSMTDMGYCGVNGGPKIANVYTRLSISETMVLVTPPWKPL